MKSPTPIHTLLRTIALSSIFTGTFGYYYDTTYVNRIDTTKKNAGPLTTTFTPPPSCSIPRTTAVYGRPDLIQGCGGPYGDECCPEGWRYNMYFSPGVCPVGYKTCTLPTTTQRDETTVICCPSGFDCNGQDYCGKTYNSAQTITYTDPTLSVVTTVGAITATGIQIRFKASESSIVPIVTDSLILPRDHSMSKKTKIGIGLGVPAAVVLLAFLAFFVMRRIRRSKENGGDSSESMPSLGQDEPPPAYERGSKR
ncbi:uncharacterized protein N7473_012580 [Penicillium subrubescens]|uniref:Uncharacterized protein n=1 Tax=Penicillium subrubescens TaxID=1316194 RepID=A0A1Q5U4S7_9EURO|nr:uncharacterized protein N7473_012580 [Penicillium subrubescens]KAJ5875233.1 hypothetical protein N7473_012580 [Penicillium subrubescens]OKP07475.1 hypothetical protein PENSUB_6064 [Penicillium subrubescens]